jgi:AcrR family transcriptional regulator
MSRKRYHHGNLKQEIIKESLQQLNLVGSDKLSFRTIAKNLGVVSSAPYNHFKSKNQLFKELINIGTDTLLKKMKNEKLKKSLPSEQLSYTARAYLKFSLEEKELFSLMFSKKNLEIKKLIDSISSQFLDIVKEKFKDGSRVRVTEKGASMTAWAMVHGLAKLAGNDNLEEIEKNVELKFEEIFNQMSAIWGKGVAN